MTLYMPLFRACTTLRMLTVLHAHLIVIGRKKDSLASTKLIEAYSQMGSIKFSRKVFDIFRHPDSFMWGVIIKCYVWNGLYKEAISMYQNMFNLGEFNNFVFPSVLRACSGINDLKMGEKVHARIVKLGFDSDPIVETSLLNMYGEIGSLCSTRKVFDEMSIRDAISWSSMIYSYVKKGKGSEGLEMFREMVREGLEIDSVTLLSVAEACGELGELCLWRVGKSVHCFVVRRSIGLFHEKLWSCIVAMYGKFGDMCSAERFFYNGAFESVSSWTAMMSCYNQNGYNAEAVGMLIEMQESNVEPNSVTLMNVVCSCARLEWLREGKSVHGYVIRKHVDPDRDFLRSSLIDLYASCGKVNYSRQIFDMAVERHVVSWNIIIAGYVQEQMAEEALSLFEQMLSQGIFPDSYALSSALAACGIVGISEFGCEIHCFVIKTCLTTEFVENALIDMYAKCGFIELAYRVFHDAQPGNVVAWNCMICGFSQNGYSEEAMNLFIEMYMKSHDIDEITFLSVIQACSNAGFVDQGKWITIS